MKVVVPSSEAIGPFPVPAINEDVVILVSLNRWAGWAGWFWRRGKVIHVFKNGSIRAEYQRTPGQYKTHDSVTVSRYIPLKCISSSG